MKTIRFASILMALVMVTMSVVSCGGASKNQVNCTVSVVIDGVYVVDEYDCLVTYSGEETPVVLDAVESTLTDLGIDYEISSTSLERIKIDGKEYAKGFDESGENLWFWVYTLNGVEPENGSASMIEIAEGDYIEYVYTSMTSETPEEDTTEEGSEETESTEEAEG